MPGRSHLSFAWRAGALLAAALTSGCANERKILPQLQAWCERHTPAFGADLGSSPADQQVAQRFGNVCLDLSRQDGLDFGEDIATYACRTMLPRAADPTGFRSPQAFEQAFGRRLDLNSFDSAASQPDDLRRRLYHQIQTSGDWRTFESQIPIGAYSSMGGVEVTFLILVNPKGQIARVLYTHADLNAALRGVRSVDGALTMLQLRELTGQPQVEFQAKWTSPLCLTGEISEETAGWRISAVPVQPECRPETLDDFHVNRSGATTLLRSRRSFSATIVCH